LGRRKLGVTLETADREMTDHVFMVTSSEPHYLSASACPYPNSVTNVNICRDLTFSLWNATAWTLVWCQNGRRYGNSSSTMECCSIICLRVSARPL